MRAAWPFLVLWIAGCSCGSDAGTRDAGRPPPSAPAPLDAQQRVVRDWLRAQAISETHFGAPVLYAWLDDAEIEALRGGASVTTASTADDAFDAALAADGSEIAAHLREPTLAGRRRAWPSAWARRRDDTPARLARIELRPESVLLVYDTRTSPPTVHFSTERGVAAPFDEALQVSALWAAVLFVHSDEAGARREYVLVNADMIARVNVGSSEIANELRTERERLLRLARDLPATAPPIGATAIERAWAALPPEDASIETAFASALAAPADTPLARTALVTRAAALTDGGEPFEWRTSLPSEPRPHFFD